jgi:hypothetical protein
LLELCHALTQLLHLSVHRPVACATLTPQG